MTDEKDLYEVSAWQSEADVDKRLPCVMENYTKKSHALKRAKILANEYGYVEVVHNIIILGQGLKEGYCIKIMKH